MIVSGTVQGVGFRWYAMRTARRSGIRGWVRNRTDGKVEIVAEADTERLRKFIGEILRGYLGENIRDIEEREEDSTGPLEGFRIVP